MVRSATGIASMSAPATSVSATIVAVPVAAAVTNEGMAIFSADLLASTGDGAAGAGAEGAGMTGVPLEVADADTGALTGVGDARGTRGDEADGRVAPHAERTCSTRGVTVLAGCAAAFGVTERGLPQAERTCTTWRWTGLGTDAVALATDAAALNTGAATLVAGLRDTITRLGAATTGATVTVRVAWAGAAVEALTVGGAAAAAASDAAARSSGDDTVVASDAAAVSTGEAAVGGDSTATRLVDVAAGTGDTTGAVVVRPEREGFWEDWAVGARVACRANGIAMAASDAAAASTGDDFGAVKEVGATLDGAVGTT